MYLAYGAANDNARRVARTYRDSFPNRCFQGSEHSQTCTVDCVKWEHFAAN